MSLLPLVALALAGAATPADGVVGMWRTGTRNGVVEIQKCGASICGRLVTSELLRTQPDLKDVKNANTALRTRPLKGLLLLSGFTSDGSAWSGGQIYNADDGKTYKATVTPINANQIKVRGCVFVPFCKTQTWVRIR